MSQRREPEIGAVGQRSLAVEAQRVEGKDGVYELSFASAAPVRRWFGNELLEMSAAAIDASYLDAGAAVLWNHDRDAHLGVVESWRIDGDRLRCTIRFGSSDLAQAKRRDLDERILRHTSIGYRIDAVAHVPGTDEDWLITRWTPTEVTLCSVPADPSVGAGRSAEPVRSVDPDHALPSEPAPSDTPPTTTQAAVVAVARSNSMDPDQVAEIVELGQQHGLVAEAAAHIRAEGSLDKFRQLCLERIAARPAATDPEQVGRGLDLSPRDQKRYSLMRALKAIGEPGDGNAQREAGFELECSRALRDKGFGRDERSIIVPADVQLRAYSALNTATSATNTGDTGGYLVGTQHMPQAFIDVLRAASFGLQRCTTMTGLQGNVSVPKKTGKGSAGWVTEGSAAALTDATFSAVTLSPKTVAARMQYTRQMTLQASPDVEMLLLNDIAEAIAYAIDRAIFYGSASSGQPRGIKNVSGIAAPTITDPPTWLEIVTVEKEVADDNALTGRPMWAASAGFRGYCKSIAKFSGSGYPIWEDGGTVNGYPAFISSLIEAADVFFGDFKQMLIGLWGGLELLVDPYTLATSGGKQIVAFQSADMAVRHAACFSYSEMTEA